MGYSKPAILLLFVIAATTFFLKGPSSTEHSDSQLDLNCGFTDDFSKFLKDNGMVFFTKDIQVGALKGLISNVLLSEVRLIQPIKLIKCQSSSFMGMETLDLDEEKLMVMNLFKLALDS